MAVLGMTKIDAVNQCLAAIGEGWCTALETGGTSDVAEAERYVDMVTRQECTKFWPCNTTMGKVYTPAGSPTIVTLGTDVLNIRHVRKQDENRFSVKGDKVWDQRSGSTTISDATILLDIAVLLSYEDCSPDLKETIAAKAALLFQRRKQGNPIRDSQLTQEGALTDINVSRTDAKAGMLGNDRPILPVPQQQQ